MHYLYKISDTLNNKIYIGQSIEPEKRWTNHKYDAQRTNPPQYIHRAMKKYGIINFIFDIIATCKNQDDANYIEDILVIQYDSRNKENGYNICPGGFVGSGEDHPMFGKHHTDESKQKIADFQKQLNQLPELIENKRKKMLGNTYCVGRKDSIETIAKRMASIGDKLKGKKRSPEQIENIKRGIALGKGHK